MSCKNLMSKEAAPDNVWWIDLKPMKDMLTYCGITMV